MMIKNKLKMEPRFAKQPLAFMTLPREKTISHEETRTIMMQKPENKKNTSHKRSRNNETAPTNDRKKREEKKEGGSGRFALKCFNNDEVGQAAFKCPDCL